MAGLLAISATAAPAPPPAIEPISLEETRITKAELQKEANAFLAELTLSGALESLETNKQEKRAPQPTAPEVKYVWVLVAPPLAQCHCPSKHDLENRPQSL